MVQIDGETRRFEREFTTRWQALCDARDRALQHALTADPKVSAGVREMYEVAGDTARPRWAQRVIELEKRALRLRGALRELCAEA
jgi:hypothetical protein